MQNKAIEYHRRLRGKIEISVKSHIKNSDDLSMAYTPGVAEVSKAIARDPSQDKFLTNKGNTIAIITNGTAVLGLGDIGERAAIPVMEGKSVLFKEMGNIDAYPIVIKEKDPKKMIQIIKAISPSFSGINLEDIKAPECFEIDSTLKKELDIPVFHDDQHGAAITILAGIINSLKVTNKKINDVKIIINGCGAAGLATANLLLDYGAKNLIAVDKYGIISQDSKQINIYQKQLAVRTKTIEGGTLEKALIDTDIFIGLSKGNILTSQMIQAMKKEPIIFALANPIPEIMPVEAKKANAKIIATGRSDFPNQINNAIVFPGLFRGLLNTTSVKQLSPKQMIKIAENIANIIKDPTSENIIPSIFNKQIVPVIENTIINF